MLHEDQLIFEKCPLDLATKKEDFGKSNLSCPEETEVQWQGSKGI